MRAAQFNVETRTVENIVVVDVLSADMVQLEDWQDVNVGDSVDAPFPLNSIFVSFVTDKVQARLDAFAKQRNYDGIMSACTYAASTNPTFQAEGQKCVLLRDATWSALYTILAEVQAGTRPTPTSFSDIEGDLPVLSWENM